MIKYSLKDGDVVKILPIIDSTDKVHWLIPFEFTSLKGKLIVDISESKYLSKIQQKSKKTLLSVSKSHFMNCLVNGELKTTNFGQFRMQVAGRAIVSKGSYGLLNVITQNWDLVCNVKSPYHLSIIATDHEVYGRLFKGLDKSTIIKKDDWLCPIADPDSGQQWIDFIKSNQEDIFTHYKEKSVFKHRDLLIKHFGSDIIGEIIAEERQKKLEKLGI